MELLGKKIKSGSRNFLELEVASLYTRTRIAVPVIVEKASEEGPTLLVLSGIHGDEVNGIETNRRLLFEGTLRPDRGVVIHIPIANVMAFINLDRKFADGRDLNRCFPGSAKGSLANQLGHLLSTEIIPHVDMVIDLHTGSEDRNNVAQIRFDISQPKNEWMAATFAPPFTLLQHKAPRGSLRRLLSTRNIPNVIFEGGKSRSIDLEIVSICMAGVLNIARGLGIKEESDHSASTIPTIRLENSHWVRANSAGMLEPLAQKGSFVERGDIIAHINGPYAQFQKAVKTRRSGYVICVNESPVVHRGDALYHLGETPVKR